MSSNKGPFIGIFNQYAYLGQGKTIHSTGQLQWFKSDVDTSSSKVGGKQRIKTIDGYTIPLSIRGGLPYFDMTKPTQEDLATLPHVIMTSDIEWDPTVLDSEGDDLDLSDDDDYGDDRVDLHGNYTGRVVQFLQHLWLGDTSTALQDDDQLDADDNVYGRQLFSTETNCVSQPDENETPKLRNLQVHSGHQQPRRSERIKRLQDRQKGEDLLPGLDSPYHGELPFTLEELDIKCSPRITQRKPEDLQKLQPKLAFAPLSSIWNTLQRASRFYKTIPGIGRTPMHDHWKTRFPACNHPRRNEAVATDWICSDTPAIDDGSMGAQLFIGTETLVTDAFGAKTDKQFVNHLEDTI